MISFTLRLVLLIQVLQSLYGSVVALPTTNVTTTSSTTDETLSTTNLTAPKRRPSPLPPVPLFPTFGNLLSNRISRLNDTSPHAPLFLLSIHANAHPQPSTSGSAFTTLLLVLYSPESNIYLSTYNSFAAPHLWTTPMEHDRPTNKLEATLLTYWSWQEVESKIDDQIQSVSVAGPMRIVWLGKLRNDPAKLGQLYWGWQSPGGETWWQGDRDHMVRRLTIVDSADIIKLIAEDAKAVGESRNQWEDGTNGTSMEQISR